MKGYRTPVGPPEPKIAKPVKKTSHEMDELCKTCGHMFRKHLMGGRSCGEYPCICDKFVASSTYYDWATPASIPLGRRMEKNG